MAVVTGSSRGIGRAIAVRLTSEGCSVVINYSKDAEGAKETQKIIGKNSIVVQADVSNAEECRKLVHEAIKKFGKIDILVNNAGITNRKLVGEVTENDWELTMNTNLKSAFFMSQFVSNFMREGSIVNISSVRAFKTRSSVSVYSATKAAIASLTMTLAIELAPKGIRVNAITPGYINTDINKDLPKEFRDNAINSVPLKRFGEPEEIANVTAFLVSDEARYITGEVVVVDGGYLC